jgi:membrane-associated protease RseP (regulator of RpoE activity)
MLFAEAAAIGGVHLEEVDRCTANRCASDNEDCVALEVLIPLVLTGMKQSDKCAAFGVKRAEIWPLMRVAVVTGESKVFTVVGAAVLASDDMLDVIGEKRLCRLRQAAVFAAMVGPLKDILPEPLVHQAA